MSEWRYDEHSGSFRRSDGSGGGEGYNRSPKKSNDDWVSWLLIAFLFFSGIFPLPLIGLYLLIAKLRDGTTKRSAAQQSGNRVQQAAKKVTKTPSDTAKSAYILQIVGGTIAALFGFSVLSELGDLIGGYWVDWSTVLSSLGFVAGGAAMFLSGRKMMSRRGRVERYRAVMGERDFVTMEELIAVTGKKRGTVEKDINYMLQKSLLGTGAFYDAGRGILFRSADAYQRYLQERTRREELTPKEANEGYSGALRAIRAANDRIPDPVFSEKLDRMENIAGKIFREVEAHPEKQKQASTFFDYYLPTTLKLLGTYTEFEEAGIEGENLRQAKARIESIMDNLLENFEKQLDELYRSEAMDVDADIRVMESMLNRDLSSVARDFGLDGGAAVQSKPE